MFVWNRAENGDGTAPIRAFSSNQRRQAVGKMCRARRVDLPSSRRITENVLREKTTGTPPRTHPALTHT